MYFNINEKERLFYRVKEPDGEKKGCVLIVHGYAEHGGRYMKCADYLAGSGFRVYIPDLPGHGQSTGIKGLAENPVLVSEYLKNFTDFIRKENSSPEQAGCSKLFLLGHSMGGGISLIYASSFGSSISGVVTSGAAVHPMPYPPLPVRAVMGFFSRYLPGLKTMELGDEKISTLQDVVEDYRNDPLNYNGKVMLGTAVELFRIRKVVEANADKITEPVFLLHGSDDRLASPEGSEFVYNSVSSEDRKIRIYDGCRHEILNDFRQEEVLEDIKNWLLERV